MGKINMQKVVIGGLIAGVVLNLIDYLVFNVALKAQMEAAMTALGKSAPTGSQILSYVVLDFVIGVFMVWLYAAIRPRFGAGPATAAKAGLAAWVMGCLVTNAFLWVGQIFPHSFLTTTTIIALIEWPLAAVVGAKFYTEGAGATAGAGAGMGARM